MPMDDLFLPGVPEEHVLVRLNAAGGNEVASGKLASPESSAALAINTFGWFIKRPELSPVLPGTECTGSAERVEVEFCARFPWSGGRHPWLDAAVFTATHLIGVESKRYEPFRDAKSACFASAYSQPVWGENMVRFAQMRDSLQIGKCKFVHLDAAQLVKHAFGLVTQGRRMAKRPILFYLYAEPASRDGNEIPQAQIHRHRAEIAEFAAAIAGDEVGFAAASYQGWLSSWQGASVKLHRDALLKRFGI